MGASGSKTVTATSHNNLTFKWSESSQSVANNTTTIAWSLVLTSDSYGKISSSASKTWSVTVNGTSYSGTNTVGIAASSSKTLASGSTTITHGADGKKSFSYSFSQKFGITFNGSSIGTVSGSGTGTLTTIPRASSISMSAGTMGTSSTISISRASSSFTHTLTYTFGSASGTIVTKTTATSVSWKPALTLANQIPSSTSGTCTIKCTTYSGSTSIGTKSISVKLSVPSSVVPTISSLNVTRVDGDVPSSWGIYVQSKSKATLSISGAAGSYGSKISSYSISGGGFSSTASSLTTGFLNTSGTITFTAKVTDSRGRTSSAIKVSIEVVPYSAPSFSTTSSVRCNSQGTVIDNGTYVKGNNTYSYASCNSNNTITTNTYYKKSTDSDWTNANVTFSSGTNFVFGSGNISTEVSYDIKYTLTDAFNSISIIDSITTASVVMDFKSGGLGVAVGKVAETDRTFEVSEDWTVKVYGKELVDFIYPVGSIYISVNSTNPAYLFGGTWTAWGSGRVPVGINTSDSSFSTVEKTGGEKTHTLTVSEMPSHTHIQNAHTHALKVTGDDSVALSGANPSDKGYVYRYYDKKGVATNSTTATNQNTGGGSAHNNLQPYITCYMWKRTA